ncbi:PREDICTED: uncharacterized protein LOC109298076 [Gavialis gangeticus]|uniref:uncharacterized protein LOC109298076 n=1 Tax=Gavialis gangeticus TaxID=94835 RepID=UPI00092E8735|nr:PREDICTED: uncharacterized protein LOC109298076 [Gavialis gangeticus]
MGTGTSQASSESPASSQPRGQEAAGVEEGAGEGPRETPADRALVLARAAWPHLCPPCPTSLPLSGPGLTLSPFLPTAVIPRPATEDEDEDEEEDEDGSPPEEAARLLVIKHLQEPGQRLDGKDGQRFLLAILTLSTVAEQSTEVAMQLEGLKVPMVEKIVVSTMQHGMVWREGRRGETVSWIYSDYGFMNVMEIVKSGNVCKIRRKKNLLEVKNAGSPVGATSPCGHYGYQL